ncbi:MAG: DNA (cytosine-5-)-methyltransferase [Candidatus Paceibacterota bacterium]|jgi:DNA (cytosine-5)-methyltransferase 1|nr:DNA (cytosine-5-)-methyltransferase [bacterium]
MGKNKDKTKEYKFIDLFAGIGGFRLALESLNLKCVYSSEWDKFAQQTYKNRFNELPDGDITKVDEKKIPKHNIICAGFPCQAFSISGKQKGFEDTRGTLFFDIVRIAKHHNPEVLFLENVKNLTKHRNGETLKIIEKTLDTLGYTAFHQVINASHYGVPASRERIYFVCFRKDLNIKNFDFPKPTFENVKLSKILQKDKDTEKYIINRKDIKINEEKIKLKTSDIFGNNFLKPIRIGTINNGGQGERIYSPEGHAITLSAYGGGAAGKTGAYLINGKVRKLSPRECARVMGFPDDFKLPENSNQAYKQLGNSVVVPVLTLISHKIIDTINKNI